MLEYLHETTLQRLLVTCDKVTSSHPVPHPSITLTPPLPHRGDHVNLRFPFHPHSTLSTF